LKRGIQRKWVTLRVLDEYRGNSVGRYSGDGKRIYDNVITTHGNVIMFGGTQGKKHDRIGVFEAVETSRAEGSNGPEKQENKPG
jgi:hypothetical protein